MVRPFFGVAGRVSSEIVPLPWFHLGAPSAFMNRYWNSTPA
jgi:hypothetical protein